MEYPPRFFAISNRIYRENGENWRISKSISHMLSLKYLLDMYVDLHIKLAVDMNPEFRKKVRARYIIVGYISVYRWHLALRMFMG